MIADVLNGVDSLGDEADLPFNWDLRRMMNFDADAHRPPADARGADGVGQEDELEPHDYEFKEGDVILMKPGPNADQRFYLGEIVALGEGDRAGEYEVWWLEPSGVDEWTGWRRKVKGRTRMTDWQYWQACQCLVNMTNENHPNRSRNVFKRSKKEIEDFIERWAAAEVEDSGREDSEPELEDGNDSC